VLSLCALFKGTYTSKWHQIVVQLPSRNSNLSPSHANADKDGDQAQREQDELFRNSVHLEQLTILQKSKKKIKMKKNLDVTDAWGINTGTSIKFNFIQELSFGTCLLRTDPYTETLSVCFDSDVTFL